MVRRRRPVSQGPQEPAALRPQASPVDTFYRPNRARPEDSPIFDLAPLSKTIQGYLEQKAREDAARSAQAGERFADENPQLVAQLEADAAKIKDQKERAEFLRREFARLQKEGLPASADPFFQIGYARSTAKRMLGDYRRRLHARLTEVSDVTDPQTGQPGLPVDPNTVLAEEWSNIADSPAIQNYYGGQVALGLKRQVDEEFLTKVGHARAEKIEADYRTNLQNDVGQQFDRLIAANPVVDSSTLQPITEFLATEVRGHNVPRPRELVLDALKLSFQRLGQVDPDEAVRAIYAAQDLVVENTRLGDDRSGVGQELEALKARYQELAEQHDRKEIARRDDARKLAIQKGQDYFMPLLQRAKREGDSVTLLAQRLEEQILRSDAQHQQFDGQAAFVVDALHDYTRALDSARESDQGVIQQLNVLVADGQLDAAETLARSALAQEQLTGEDYHSTVNLLTQRRGVSEFVESSPVYQAVRGRYREAKPTGYAEEVQNRIDDQALELERRLERDYVALVRSTEGKTNREELHRAWLEERETADKAVLRKQADEVRGRRDELMVGIRQAFQRFDGADGMIEQGLQSGVLSAVEAQTLREEGAKAVGGREQFYTLEEYRLAHGEIDAQFEIDTGGAPSTEDLQMRDAAHQALRDRYDAALDEFLKDPTTDPRQYRAHARAALQTVKGELGDQLFGGARRTVERGVAGGESVEEIRTGIEARKVDQARVQALAATLADPEARERLSADDPVLGEHHPDVPEPFYRFAAQWMSGLDPFFGSRRTREDVEAAAYDAARLALAKSAADATGAVSSIVNVLGVDAVDVLRGETQLSLSAERQARIRQEIERIEAGQRAGLWRPAYARPITLEQEAAGLREQLEPVTLDLKSVQWQPYTTAFFRSEAALAAFSADPAWPDFLAAIGIDPEDEREVDAFVDAQTIAIAARNP